MSHQSSITVGVRVRPFTREEENKLIPSNSNTTFYADGQIRHNQEQQELELMRRKPNFIRKIVNVVDDKMLVFDPQETNPYLQMQRRNFPQMSKSSRIKDLKFVFDHLYDEQSSQRQVFEGTTKPLLDTVLEGYNATVFAYGATGCGKTHTILGTLEEPGLIFLTMQELYEKIEKLSDARVFDVLILFLEIYNESIRDLLCPETSHKKLNLREDLLQRIVVSNLLVHKPQNVNQVMEMIVVGNQNRTCSPTEANATLSRSHAVLQINVSSTSRLVSLLQEHSYATLSIIDLAGSERAATTKNRGERLAEGANINKSLLALGNCINALCAGTGPNDRRRRVPHVPYRDLKLTRLLKFSLGGNCKTVMIVCISPLSKHYDETLNALKYADRAKEIKTKVVRNQQNLDRHVGLYLKMITEQKQEIAELRAREADVRAKARQEALLETGACVQAILSDVAAMRQAIDRNSGAMWERVEILAKRKVMMMKLDELRIVQEQMWEQSGGPKETGAKSAATSMAAPATISRLARMAEQVRVKMQRDIVALEHAYEATHDLDDTLARSTALSAKRLAELPAYDLQMAAVHLALCTSVHDSIEKDILVNSSVLLDHLIGELDQYKVGAALARYMQDNSPDSVPLISDILQRMMTESFSLAVDEAAAIFVASKSSSEKLLSGIETPEKCDKRSSTLPLSQIPSKRRVARVDHINSSFEDFHAIPKSDFEDDTTAFDHVNHSILDANELGFSPGLLSPPEARKGYEALEQKEYEPLGREYESLGRKGYEPLDQKGAEPLGRKGYESLGRVDDGLSAGRRRRYISASSAGHARFGNEEELEAEMPADFDDRPAGEMQDDYDTFLRHPLLNKEASKVVTRD